MLPSDACVLASDLPARVRDKLFAQRLAAAGTPVAVRLNLRGGSIPHQGRLVRLQTVHAGSSPTGKVIGYDALVTVERADFVVLAEHRRDILLGIATKHPMAAIAGDLVHGGHDLSGIEIRFNPKREHLFVEAATGRAVRSAERVTVFDTRAYAHGVRYWTEADAPSSLGLPSQAHPTWPLTDRRRYGGCGCECSWRN